MSAIAGILSRRERHSAQDVAGMLEAMGARGRHSRLVQSSGPCLLGSGQLPGRPPAALHPASIALAPPVGDWAICADARLDAPQTLQTRFGGPPLTTTGLILEAFQRWGEDCVAQLSGDFAFAIWDPRRQQLFFARDRLGVAPFHYCEDGGRFAFASEVKALLALSSTPRRTPRIRLAEFLEGHSPPEDETFFADVRRLPPGSHGWAGHGFCRSRKYWRLTLPEPYQSPDPAAEFAQHFQTAVEARLPAHGPVVSMLSGGLDSSAVSGAARQAVATADGPLKTISMVFPDSPEGDERPYIDAVLSTGDYRATFVDIGRIDPFAGFARSLAIQDGLFLAPGLTLNRSLYSALDEGTVLLSGHGGDEVVSKGAGRLHDLARGRQWQALWREAAGAADLYGSSKVQLFWSFLSRYGPGRYKLAALTRAARRLPGLRSNPQAPQLLNPALAEVYDRELRSRDSGRRSGRSGRALDLDVLRHRSQPYALEILDRESAAAGVESRYPFWDERLIRFSLSLDPSTKLGGGWTRLILRQAMAPSLPDVVRWRRDKHDFSPVVVRGMLASPAASAERFQAERDRLAAFLNLDAVEAARHILAADPSRPMGAEGQVLWRATALAEWLELADREGIRIV